MHHHLVGVAVNVVHYHYVQIIGLLFEADSLQLGVSVSRNTLCCTKAFDVAGEPVTQVTLDVIITVIRSMYQLLKYDVV